MDGLPQDFGDTNTLPDLNRPEGAGVARQGATNVSATNVSAHHPQSNIAPMLTKRAKAAVIVRLLAAEDVKLPLSSFPETMQVELAHQLATLRYIDKTTLTSIVTEFLDELGAVGLSFPGGLEGALSVLDGTISPTTSEKMRKSAGISSIGDPWERISKLEIEQILPILEEESVEVGAVLLSKLKVSKSAQLLSTLPGERARRIAYAISLTSAIAPDVVQRIGTSIAAKLDARPKQAFTAAPTERVGAILNFSASATREGVLEGLDETDKTFAAEVRKNIFTFANIATRVDARDVAKVVRGVEPEELVKALAGATGPAAESTEFILTNMSKRMADGLREEMEGLGSIKTADAEAAMNLVIASIRELEESGEIVLITEDE